MYSKVLRSVLYPVGEMFQHSSMLEHLRQVEKSQWWSSENLKELQENALRLLISHAYHNVPYYHHVFKERGLTDKDITTVEDLGKLPILTKSDIRRNFQRITANDSPKWRPFINVTSGSTGQPLQYLLTMDTVSMNWACTFRGWGWAGYELGDRMIQLGGSSVVPFNIPFKLRMRYLIERKTPLTSLGMTQEVIGNYTSIMKRVKPKYIYGYPSSIAVLAKHLADRNDRSIELNAVLTTAETLVHRHRRLIEETFGCKVFDQYGCYDGGAQALECHTHEGYHLSQEKVITEFLDEKGTPARPGSPGEIVCTDLFNYAMPFIRYATGDIGVFAEDRCSCGRGLPLIESIQGRRVDQIVLKDGSTIPGLPLGDVLEDIEKDKRETFESYQIVQKEVSSILVRIVSGSKYTEDDGRRIVREIKKHLGEDVDVAIELVEEIPTTKGGKTRFIISEIDNA